MHANSDPGYITSLPIAEQNKRRRIRTFTGQYVDPLAMRAREIDIRDIAHALSNIGRYTGHCPQFYSVAQHSVWVSRQFADRELRLAGLLHDAAEAYLNDFASPVKHRFPDYVDAMTRLEKQIFAVFGLDWKLMAAVKPADEAAFFLEVKSFWEPHKLALGEIPIVPVLPVEAKQAFWAEYRRIGIVPLTVQSMLPAVSIEKEPA